MTEDIVYIVKVKPEFQINFKGTTINYEFAGEILAQIRDAYVFKLNGAYGALVIIPLDWIECMAPSKVHFELMQKSTPLYCCGRPLQAINKKTGKCGQCGSEYWIEI